MDSIGTKAQLCFSKQHVLIFFFLLSADTEAAAIEFAATLSDKKAGEPIAPSGRNNMVMSQAFETLNHPTHVQCCTAWKLG